MEEKKFDFNTIIGFGLIFIIIFWMMYNGQKTSQNEQLEKARITKDSMQKAKQTAPKNEVVIASDSTVTDSAKIKQLQGTLGSFAYSSTLPSTVKIPSFTSTRTFSLLYPASPISRPYLPFPYFTTL